MNSLHHHLWNTGTPIEPETTRLLNVVPYEPEQLPDYLFSVATQNGWAVYVKKPELPKSEFIISLCFDSISACSDWRSTGPDVISVIHRGTDHCPYDKVYSAVMHPVLCSQFTRHFFIYDKPTNLYMLRALQFERDPDSDIDAETYWTLRAFYILLGASIQCG